jgi:hypothetical protein
MMSVGVVAAGATRFTLTSSSASRSDILGSSSTGKSGSRISSGRNSVWITVTSRLAKSLTRNAASCILLRIAHCTMAMPSAKVPGAQRPPDLWCDP